MNVFAPSVAFSHSGDGSFCANSAFITSRRLGIMPDRRFFVFHSQGTEGPGPAVPFLYFLLFIFGDFILLSYICQQERWNRFNKSHHFYDIIC